MGKNSKKNREIRAAAIVAGVEAPVLEQAAAELVEFDVWWVMRSERIPPHHMKEVIKADMNARGLTDKESLEDFDEALKDYGIK